MKFYFGCGLPRSGSTLLTAILNQNPDIHAGVMSPVLELIQVSAMVLSNEPAIVAPKPYIFQSIIRSNIVNYYSDRVESIIIDKNRVWPNHINLIKKYITPNPKLIGTTRNVLDILASFITLIHKGETVSYVDKGLMEYGVDLTDDNRCHFLMSSDNILFRYLESFKDPYKRNHKHHIHLIEYDDLISKPSEVMGRIHEFLELDPFTYTFNNITPIEREDDSYYGLPTMHEVRPELKKISKPYTEVLSKDIIDKYKDYKYYD